MALAPDWLTITVVDETDKASFAAVGPYESRAAEVSRVSVRSGIQADIATRAGSGFLSTKVLFHRVLMPLAHTPRLTETDSVRAIWDILFAQPDYHAKGLSAVEHQRVAILGTSLSLREQMLCRTL